ncbi:hypothetical protein ACSBR2_034328 [Camellia fascicularis]
MSFLHVIGFGLKVGHLLLMLCCWLFFVISMNWFINGGILETKAGFLGDGTKIWVKFWEMISEIMSKIHHRSYQYIGSKRVRKTWWKNLLVTWIVFRTLASLFVFWYMSSQAVEKRLEVYQVEAKYPALLFKQQRTTYVEKIYGIVQDN